MGRVYICWNNSAWTLNHLIQTEVPDYGVFWQAEQTKKWHLPLHGVKYNVIIILKRKI